MQVQRTPSSITGDVGGSYTTVQNRASTTTFLRKHNTTTTVGKVAKDWSIRALSDEKQDRVCLMFANCARQCLRFVLAGNLPAKTKRKHFQTISWSHDLLDRL